MYSPDGINVHGIQDVGSLRAQGRCRELKIVKSCSWDGTHYSVVQTLLLWDYRLADRQTDGQTDDSIMPVANHTACSTIG